MGNSFLRSPQPEAPPEQPSALEEGPGDLGPGFAVTVTSLGGEAFAISGLQPGTTLGNLFQKVSTHCGLKVFEIKLCLGTEVFTVAESTQTLQHVGLLEGSELTLVRKSLVRLVDLGGVSRYNSSYHCTVLRVEEVGFNVLEIDIVVKGDMTAGAIQDPSHSRLRFNCANFRPTKCVYTKDERSATPCSCVEATLTYEEVPIECMYGTDPLPPVTFRFGSSGYSELVLNPPGCIANQSLGLVSTDASNIHS